MRRAWWSGIVVGLVLGLSVGCDGGGKSSVCTTSEPQACNCDGGADGTRTCEAGKLSACDCGGSGPEALEIAIAGRIFDADNGKALTGAELAAPRADTARSDGAGRFELKSDKAPPDISARRASYVPTQKPAPQASAYVELFLKPVGHTATFDSDKGLAVRLDSGTRLEIPRDAVTDAEGKQANGKMSIELAEVDGRDRKQASALPSGEAASDDKGKLGQVSLERAVSVRIRDAKGTEMQVAAEAKVTLDFPVRKDDGPGPRSAFRYDEDERSWVEEKQAERTTNETGEEVYRKDIDHLSWHGYGDFFGTLTCLRACVQDSKGEPVPGAQLWLVGASFPGVSTLFAGDDGCALGDAPVAEQVVLVAQNASAVSAPLRYTTSSRERSTSDDAAGCDGTEVLVLDETSESECPMGYVACAAECRDPASDARSCGACDGSCVAAQQCVASACGDCLWGSCEQPAMPSPWQSGDALPVPRIHAVAAAPGNGYVYILNGYVDVAACDNGTADGRAFMAKQNADGSLGAFSETFTGPTGFGRSIAGVAHHAGFIYVGGGAINGPSWDGSVWFAKPNADGTLSAWTQAASAISDWIGSAPLMGSYQGVLYLGGGFNAFASPQTTSRLYRAKLDPQTGQPGAWVAEIDLPADANQQGQLQFWNQRAYLSSGYGDVFYSADVAADGSLGPWVLSAQRLPVLVAYPSMQIVNGKIYVVSGGSGDVYVSSIAADGSLAPWALHSTVPGTVFAGNQGVYADGSYYLLGNDDCNATPADAVKVYWSRLD